MILIVHFRKTMKDNDIFYIKETIFNRHLSTFRQSRLLMNAYVMYDLELNSEIINVIFEGGDTIKYM